MTQIKPKEPLTNGDGMTLDRGGEDNKEKDEGNDNNISTELATNCEEKFTKKKQKCVLKRQIEPAIEKPIALC